MITRSKLVEQLRDSQIRSQHKWSPLVIFSPKPNLSTWVDVAVAILWATLFIVLVTSSYMTLYFRHFWLSFAIICLGILIPIRLRISRQTITRKKDRRLYSCKFPCWHGPELDYFCPINHKKIHPENS